jgi:signal transduction histidine kinase
VSSAPGGSRLDSRVPSGGVHGFRGRRSASIATRLLLASTAAAVLVAAAFAVMLFAVSDLRSATRAENRARDLSDTTALLQRTLIRLDNGVDNYLEFGRPRFLGDARTAGRESTAAFARLRMLARVAEPERGLPALVNQVEDYFDYYVVPVIEDEIDLVAANQDFAAQDLQRTQSDLNEAFDSFGLQEDARVDRLAAAADDDARRAIILAAVGLLASAGVIGIFGVYLARSIGRPVRDTAAAAAQVASGDFSLRLREGGPGEVGELTHSFNVMAERLEQNRAELQEQNRLLRESEQLKSELVSIVSHEVRTPLASVLGFTTLLLERELEPATRRRYLEIVDSQARRLSALLDDFLDVQRMEEGRLQLADEFVDIVPVLREQIELFTALSERHRLHLKLAERPLSVRGDADRLAQVVGNLLSNAIKYSPDGGDVEVVGDRVDGAVRVTVRDEGVGIPDDQQRRIFTKFYRGDAAASGITGTGLGLAFARAVVEAHGGHIDFRSAEGEGSTFWIDLPAAEAL